MFKKIIYESFRMCDFIVFKWWHHQLFDTPLTACDKSHIGYMSDCMSLRVTQRLLVIVTPGWLLQCRRYCHKLASETVKYVDTMPLSPQASSLSQFLFFPEPELTDADVAPAWHDLGTKTNPLPFDIHPHVIKIPPASLTHLQQNGNLVVKTARTRPN